MDKTRHLRRLYYGIVGLFWLAISLPLPVAVLLMQARGVDLFEIGIVMGAYTITVVLLEVPTGGLADAWGRKRVTVLAYLFLGFSKLVALFAFSFAAFLVAMILSGIGRALASGALDAWFVDRLQELDPEAELQPALAGASTVSAAALGVGTLLGGFLPQLFPQLSADGTAVLTPLSMGLLAAVLLMGILVLLVMVKLKETVDPAEAGTGWRQGFRDVPTITREALTLTRSNPTLLLLMLTTFAGGFMLLGVETFWQPRFAEILGGSTQYSWLFGIIMAGSFLVSMGGNMLSVPLSKRLHNRYGIVAALARGLQGLLLIILGLQTMLMPAMFLFWLVYLNLGVIDSPHNTLVNEQIPTSRRSVMLSVQSLAVYFGGFVGSAGLGFIARSYDIGGAWIVAGVVSMLSLLLYLVIDQRQQREEKSHVTEGPLLETR